MLTTFIHNIYGTHVKTYCNKDVIFVRSDIVEDTGSSLSPEVDIGQIEGAYIFGVGLWTCEVVKFHPETGKIITNDTWVGYFSYTEYY